MIRIRMYAIQDHPDPDRSVEQKQIHFGKGLLSLFTMSWYDRILNPDPDPRVTYCIHAVCCIVGLSWFRLVFLAIQSYHPWLEFVFQPVSIFYTSPPPPPPTFWQLELYGILYIWVGLIPGNMQLHPFKPVLLKSPAYGVFGRLALKSISL